MAPRLVVPGLHCQGNTWMLDKQEQSIWETKSAVLKGFFFLKKYSMFMIMEYTLLLAFYHEPNNFFFTAHPKTGPGPL